MIDCSDKRITQFLTDENVKLLEAQAVEICKFYKAKYGFQIVKGKYVKNALIKTIRHYTAYLKTFDCRVTSVDFYKVYSWLSYFLAEELHSKDMQHGVLRVALWRMCEALKDVGITFAERDSLLKKTLALIQNELDGNADFGMGKNGLYMSIKFASLVRSNAPNE